MLHTSSGMRQRRAVGLQRCCAEVNDLGEYADAILISRRLCEYTWSWWAEKPKECGQNDWEGIMDDSVGKPCDDVKNGYRFERRQKDYVHGRSMVSQKRAESIEGEFVSAKLGECVQGREGFVGSIDCSNECIDCNMYTAAGKERRTYARSPYTFDDAEGGARDDGFDCSGWKDIVYYWLGDFHRRDGRLEFRITAFDVLQRRDDLEQYIQQFSMIGSAAHRTCMKNEENFTFWGCSGREKRGFWFRGGFQGGQEERKAYLEESIPAESAKWELQDVSDDEGTNKECDTFSFFRFRLSSAIEDSEVNASSARRLRGFIGLTREELYIVEIYVLEYK
ncbi:hypothetical protein BD769DRAFT_1392275 [Suillus cothurnatus]|nr:hypothetical protein BD769DRAFT_1392275 [Suillus cothurnatus]